GVSEDEGSAVHGAEQVPQQGKAAPLRPREQEGRPLRMVDAALDGADFEVRIGFHVDPDQLAGPFQFLHTFLQMAITHVPAIPPRCSRSLGGRLVKVYMLAL